MIAPNPKIAATVKRYYLSNVKKRGPNNPTRGANWAQVDKAFHGKVSDYILPEDRMLKPMTADDANSRIRVWRGWRPIANELRRLERERATAALPAQENPTTVTPDEEVAPPKIDGFPIHVDKKGWATDPRNGVRVRIWRNHAISNIRYLLETRAPDRIRQVEWFADFVHVSGSLGCLARLPNNKETENRWIEPEDLPKLLEEGK